MNKITLLRSVLITIICLTAVSVCAEARAAQQEQGDGSRQILAEEFIKGRPEKTRVPSGVRPSSSGPKQTTGGASVGAQRRPLYNKRTPAVGAGVLPPSSVASGGIKPPMKNPPPVAVNRLALASAAKVGVTFWRLRSAGTTDQGARLLVQGDEGEVVPERIAAGTVLRVRDRVRLTVESPREGYLYVVDRELFSDGSMGEPYLIFPTTRTRGGDNRVRPGKLIDIPAQEDRPNYFTLIPTPGRDDQVGEVLSLIITMEPLENFEPTSKPVKLTAAQVEKWEKMWGGPAEQYDLESGEGRTWTQAESEASRAGEDSRLLTQEEPTPQTIYLIEGKNNKGLLVTVPLRYKR